MNIRAAERAELDALATLWFEGWQDGHQNILPPALARYRTWDNFRERLEASTSAMRVAGPVGTPLGFCVIKDDELYQLYVSRPARGSGVAAALLEDGETRLALSGVRTAWLAARSATCVLQGFTRRTSGAESAR